MFMSFKICDLRGVEYEGYDGVNGEYAFSEGYLS